MSCSSFFSAGFPGILLVSIALAVLIPSGRTGSDRGYGHQNPYNRNVRNENPYAANKKQRNKRKKLMMTNGVTFNDIFSAIGC